MATRADWGNGFLDCASQDLEATKRMIATSSTGLPMGSLAMLVQMVFEKLGKAYLFKHSITTQSQILRHDAGSRALTHIRQNSNWLGVPAPSSFPWKGVLRVIKDLESANPSVAKRSGITGCLEFPWEDSSTRAIQVPHRNLLVIHQLSLNPSLLPRIVKLASFLLTRI